MMISPGRTPENGFEDSEESVRMPTTREVFADVKSYFTPSNRAAIVKQIRLSTSFVIEIGEGKGNGKN